MVICSKLNPSRLGLPDMRACCSCNCVLFTRTLADSKNQGVISIKKCYIFASRRKIVWDGINYKFKRKASALEIKSKLKEWGFIGDSISSNTNATPKITKKTNITEKDDIVSQLKDLKKLLDNDVITQDEFDKIKKKLIN